MPPKKKAASKGPRGMGKPISPGLIMVDLTKKEWQLGEVIGQGGFGYIYLGHKTGEPKGSYVIKIEPHANGPLFVELAFYQRVAKPDMISSWVKEKKLKHLGVPEYVATGLFEYNKSKYRFLVMTRFGTDIEKIYKENDFVFPEATVFSLGIRMIDALEYMHAKEYVHADIKSSNIMLGYDKSSQRKAYLVDFGLAFRYKPYGTHVAYKEDPKRKHDGTIEYTSIDAHKGCVPTRRGDLEILGYCMLQWLCKKLPWEKNLEDKEYVMKEKVKYMSKIPQLMKDCFHGTTPPAPLKEYLECVKSLEYDEEPDYLKLQTILRNGLKKAGHADDGVSVILPGALSPKKRPGKTPVSSKSRKRKSPSPVKKHEVDEEIENIKPEPKKGPRKVVAVPSPEKKNPSPLKGRPTTSRGKPTIVRTENDKAVAPERVVHKRLRQRNVQTRDFGQSP